MTDRATTGGRAQLDLAPPDHIPRHDADGPIKFIARVKSFVVVRRPGAAPFVLTARKWGDLPVEGERGE